VLLLLPVLLLLLLLLLLRRLLLLLLWSSNRTCLSGVGRRGPDPPIRMDGRPGGGGWHGA
jgi:hypothetical protein